MEHREADYASGGVCEEEGRDPWLERSTRGVGLFTRRPQRREATCHDLRDGGLGGCFCCHSGHALAAPPRPKGGRDVGRSSIPNENERLRGGFGGNRTHGSGVKGFSRGQRDGSIPFASPEMPSTGCYGTYTGRVRTL